MDTCVFCKIVEKKIQANIVYEDKEFLAFLDVRPLNPGHTLVIPKPHARWVWDVKNSAQYGKTVQKVANALRKALKTDYVASLIFGEEVPHAHIHLVPRFQGDDLTGLFDFNNAVKHAKKFSDQEIKKTQEKIKNAF